MFPHVGLGEVGPFNAAAVQVVPGTSLLHSHQVGPDVYAEIASENSLR